MLDCPLFISSFQESYSLIALFSLYGWWDVCKISIAWALFLLGGLPNKKKDGGKDREAKVEEQHNIRAWADQRVERSREFGLTQNTKQPPPHLSPLILASSSSLDFGNYFKIPVQGIAGSVIHDDLCNRHIGNEYIMILSSPSSP